MEANRKFKGVFFALVCIAVLLYRTECIMACTIFTVILEDGSILACNNEDWMYSINNTMIISAPEGDSYGRVCFYNASYVQGGMNEHGLFYDGASCPSTKVPFDNTKKDLGYDLGEIVLEKCKTVKEAEEFLSAYNIPGGFYDHLLFADASGDAAVFEWVNDEFRVIWKEADKQYQLITNFWLSDPSQGGYPCSRYNTIDEALSSSELTFELSKSLLSETRQNWGDGGTLYSNICNLKEREVYLFYRGDESQAYQFNLTDELATMEPGEAKTMRMKDICQGEISKAVLSVSDTSSAAYNSDDKDAGYKVAPFFAFTLGVILVVIILLVVKHPKKSK